MYKYLIFPALSINTFKACFLYIFISVSFVSFFYPADLFCGIFYKFIRSEIISSWYLFDNFGHGCASAYSYVISIFLAYLSAIIAALTQLESEINIERFTFLKRLLLFSTALILIFFPYFFEMNNGNIGIAKSLLYGAINSRTVLAVFNSMIFAITFVSLFYIFFEVSFFIKWLIKICK